MARNRLVERAKAAAERSAAESPTESHQRRYQADLAHEIGPTTFGRADDGDDRGSLLQVMTQPAMILILAIITFALTFVVLLWREGRLGGLFPATVRTVELKDPKAWMLGRDTDGAIEDTHPTDDDADTVTAPASATSPAPAAKAADALAEDESETDSAPEIEEPSMESSQPSS